ncbi:MAG: response regulator transcription factor, partial [Gammaproteobacteria bacterium]|nr:response regulator transcription factor [Gammaproteobacteria bacterium]
MATAKIRVLLIEDNVEIAGNIVSYFEQQDFIVDYAAEGALGLKLALEHYFDVIVLDLMLPKIDGLTLCATLRQQADRHIPIIMLTARDSLSDKLQGFSQGADDYLTKPFALEELAARCMALAGRQSLQQNTVIQIGSLTIDKMQQLVTRENTEIHLQAILYKILLILAENPGKVISRSELCQRIWG